MEPRPFSMPLSPDRLSATVIDVRTGDVLLSQAGDTPRSVASVAKLLLLVEFAEQLVVEPEGVDVMLHRSDVAPVGDSGLWQHLATSALPAGDVARLVGAVSDNLATNVLLRHVGLDAVAIRTELLGLEVTRLHDIVRDHRGPADPPRLGTGSTNELARLMVRLRADRSGVAARVLDWLSLGVDLSLVGHAFGLDPLAHGGADVARRGDRGVEVWSKTGTDDGVRADVGLVRSGDTTLAYAAVANWDPSHDAVGSDNALVSLRRLGADLRSMLKLADSSPRRWSSLSQTLQSSSNVNLASESSPPRSRTAATETITSSSADSLDHTSPG